MNCVVKKLLLKSANKLLDDYKNDISVAREKVKVWLNRADTITSFLKGLDEKLEDANITEDELKSTVEELKGIIDNWKKS